MEYIKEFKGDYSFLDMSYIAPFRYKNIMFKCAEAAYQAARVSDAALMPMFSDMGGSEARCVGMYMTERKDWDEIKRDILFEIIQEKFNQNPSIIKKLCETKNAVIDNPFIGDILMRLRTQYSVN